MKVKKGQRIMKAFYLEVKEQLKNKGMSIYRLSKETGIFEQTLYSMFNGNTSSPQLDNAVKIAKVLDIDLNKLKEVKS
jgi:DNA-binding helix-turn-helix protein